MVTGRPGTLGPFCFIVTETLCRRWQGRGGEGLLDLLKFTQLPHSRARPGFSTWSVYILKHNILKCTDISGHLAQSPY